MISLRTPFPSLFDTQQVASFVAFRRGTSKHDATECAPEEERAARVFQHERRPQEAKPATGGHQFLGKLCQVVMGCVVGRPTRYVAAILAMTQPRLVWSAIRISHQGSVESSRKHGRRHTPLPLLSQIDGRCSHLEAHVKFQYYCTSSFNVKKAGRFEQGVERG